MADQDAQKLRRLIQRYASARVAVYRCRNGEALRLFITPAQAQASADKMLAEINALINRAAWPYNPTTTTQGATHGN
jgi:hypothetical protein